VFPHELDRSQKPLFDTGETEQSSFRNRTLQFCRDRLQSGALLGFDEVLLLQPSDIQTVERYEPQQLWRLWRQVVDLIEKTKRIEKLGQKYEEYKFN
jgi:hypothetical protein